MKISDEARQEFERRVQRRGPLLDSMESICWLFSNRRGNKPWSAENRPRMSVDGQPMVVARLAVILDGREFLPGECACHRCDNPLCVRASHLFVGTRRVNNLDMRAKGRAGVPWGRAPKPRAPSLVPSVGQVLDRHMLRRGRAQEGEVVRVVNGRAVVGRLGGVE